MRTCIQRVTKASVTVNQKVVADIQNGLLILLGIENEDTFEDIDWLCSKISNLRIFSDENGVMNLSVKDIQGEIIVVSQFTLFASTKKGNRPSYTKAALPSISIPLYEEFLTRLQSTVASPIQKGVFGAHMKLEIVNDGPVTILIDSKNKE